MFIPEKEFLFLFGWDDFFENQIPSLAIQDSECLSSKSFLFPARVVCEERNLYRIQAGKNFIFWASVSGKMQFNALSRVDYPAVGDWVLVDHAAYSDRGIIHHVLKRKTIIHRRQVGPNPDMQILSTNVDYTFITTSVNFDLNFRRIERYYQKLNAEIRHNLRKQDKGLAAEDRKVWKKMSQNARKKNKSTGGL